MQLSFGNEIFGKGAGLSLVFVTDPLATRKAYSDSTVAMMRAAENHGHEVFVVEAPTLGWRKPEAGHPGGVFGEVIHLHLRPDDHDWHRETGRKWMPLKNFDAVILRRDPPFDFEYLAATWLLERAEADGLRVFNRPRSLREHSDKLAIMEFAQFIPSTVISRDLSQLQHFIDEARDVILKPIDGAGMRQVFRIHRNDTNRNAILETLTQDGQRTIMAQQFLPEISAGDKCVLLIAGKTVPFCLARIPKAGETRGNLNAGGTGVAQELSARDREIAEAIGPILAKRGLLLAALDIIGQQLTGINVTNPGGMIEIRQQSGFDAASAFITAIEHACEKS